MKKLNQNGFGAAGIIGIIVVIAALIGAGWLVYSRQQNKKDATQESVVSQATPDGVGVAMNGYLGIPVFGIQLKLADSVKDAIYSVMADGSTIGLSTQSLVSQYGEGCKASTGTVAQIAALVKPAPPYGETGADNPAAYKHSYKTADDVYYVIKTTGLEGSFCSGALAASSAQAQQVISGFNDTDIQALNKQ